jgi:UDP-2,3-diacylglucosamine pyrophosphatase LpxH
MSKLKLIISDLHLANGRAGLDGFGAQQQAALRGLLRAAGPGGSFSNDEDVEFIINGDCFDFLVIRPYLDNGVITPDIALRKWEEIQAAHSAFFETLRDFLHTPGRRVTFMVGNHDVELAFAEVREAVQHVICTDGYAPEDNLFFCETRCYRPLADVHIEHGHHYDFWNNTGEVWDEQGNPRDHRPDRLTLPVGTQYFQRAAAPISMAYGYFDRLEPSLDSSRQIALLCLFNPGMVIETAQRAMAMLSYPRVALESLKAGEERIPARLFEVAMLDFAAFQQDMLARRPEWQAVEGWMQAHATEPRDPQAGAIAEFYELREALSLPLTEAVKAILQPRPYAMGESVALGMQCILRDDPSLRYAIAGHTHMLRRDILNDGTQTYLNTGTWTNREYMPAPEEVTPELVQWLREPWQATGPLRDATCLTFALVRGDDGQASTAELCVWDGGEQGHYRVLPYMKE